MPFPASPATLCLHIHLLGPELVMATFTLRTQPLPSLLSFTLCNSNGFPNNSLAQHNLLFCVGEDLWDDEVYTSKQFQHTWKWLCRRQTSDKSWGEGAGRRCAEGACHAAQCFSNIKVIPVWEHSISSLADVSYCVGIYDTLKYFPKIPVQDLTHVGLDRAGPRSSVIPQAPENSFLVVRVTMLEEGVETNQPECSSLYVFVTVRVSHYTYSPCHKVSRPQLACDPMQPFIEKASNAPQSSCSWELYSTRGFMLDNCEST